MPDSLAIAAGEFRHVVTIAQANTTEDKFGGSDPALAGATALANVYAKIEALTLREIYGAQQRTAEVSHRVSIRYISGVRAGMLVWFGSRQFQIQAVNNVQERNKLLVLLCLERDDSVREEGAGDSAAAGGMGGSFSSPGGSQPSGSGFERHYPTGPINGVNVAFGFSPAPADPGGFILIWNGLIVEPSEYTLAGGTVTTTGFVPHTGDSLYAIY